MSTKEIDRIWKILAAEPPRLSHAGKLGGNVRKFLIETGNTGLFERICSKFAKIIFPPQTGGVYNDSNIGKNVAKSEEINKKGPLFSRKSDPGRHLVAIQKLENFNPLSRKALVAILVDFW